MKLVAQCNSCKEQIKVPGFMIENRVILAQKKGTEFELRCEKCSHTNKLHVDDVKAVHDYTVYIFVFVALILATYTTIAFLKVGFIAFISLALPFIVWGTISKNQRDKINLFNRLYYDSQRLTKNRILK